MAHHALCHAQVAQIRLSFPANCPDHPTITLSCVMTVSRIYPLTLFVLLTACASGERERALPVNTLVCDSFLIYDMCAQDLNGDGEVEFVWFADTYEVFLFREDTAHRVPDDLTLHRCAQQMNDDIVRNASMLFFIDDDTGHVARLDIKGALIASYMSYIPRVNRCNAQYEDGAPAIEPPADEFDFEFEEFGG